MLPPPSEPLVPFPSGDGSRRLRVAGLGDELYRLVDGGYGAQAHDGFFAWERG